MTVVAHAVDRGAKVVDISPWAHGDESNRQADEGTRLETDAAVHEDERQSHRLREG